MASALIAGETEIEDEPILVVAAHPDDEVLFSGGTIAREAAQGRRVEILFLADGEGARFSDPEAIPTAQVSARRASACRAAEILGACPPRFLDFPDNRLDSVPLLEVIRVIETILRDVRPSTVITHHSGDLNIDHRITHEAVATACRPKPDAAVVRVIAGETLSSTEWRTRHAPPFEPTFHIDIIATLDVKLQALQAYGDEVLPFPNARSIQACRSLAEYRGAAVGLHAAEAFEMVRWVARNNRATGL